MTKFISVCRRDEMAEGEARLFVVEDRQIAVFLQQGSFFALDNECPHAGASLAHGIIQAGTVRCRIHHWRFRICDGKYLDADEPRHNVRSYQTRIVGGEVQVACGELT